VESLTRQWGQLRQVRSKSEGRRSPTLCSLGNPFSLAEAQANDCCNSWHIRGRGTESLYIDFCRHTTGVSAPCSGLVVFSVTASSKTEKRACGERILHFTAGGWGHGACAWPEWQCAAYAWSKVHLQLVEFHCVGDGSWQATTQNLPAARLMLRSRAEKDFKWKALKALNMEAVNSCTVYLCRPAFDSVFPFVLMN